MEPLITKLEFELKHNHSINFYSTNLGWLNINIFKLVLSPFHVSLLFKYKSGNHKISLVFLIITKNLRNLLLRGMLKAQNTLLIFVCC